MEMRFEEPREDDNEGNGSSSHHKTGPAQAQIARPDLDNLPSIAAQTHLDAPKGVFMAPPMMEEVILAHRELQMILKPARKTGRGHKDPELDSFFKARLEGMKQFMWTYINPKSGATGQWAAASLQMANNLEKGPSHTKKLRNWTRAFIADRENLPVNPYGAWNESMIDKDPEIAQSIHAHLQSRGKFVKAMDLVNFLDTPEMRERSGLKKRINISTAQQWMKKLDYQWTYDPKGQYVDGHEREDVVEYRQKVFLPRWANIQARTHDWSKGLPDPLPHERKTVVWFHDESTFYANDRRVARWVHESEDPKPYAKGEGASQMVADLVSADYGWLRSPDGTQEARVLFKAGKNREGYFTSEDVLKQVEKAIGILKTHYPDDDHVLIYDNATTHLKRASGALSARCMPKFTSKPESNWLVEVNAQDANGKPIYTPDGKLLKAKIQMDDATLPDGTNQPLYFPPGHEKAGLFKGMEIILQERGLHAESQLKAQCNKKFDCPNNGRTNCCCRRTLYNQPDFIQVDSLLESYCRSCRVEIIFLPKFHCELNFIEQCWGFAKRIYRHYPASSKEADLEQNMLSALESVPIDSMRRLSQYSL